ncbi:MAG: recombination protein RecR [Planctomycetes bacterium]|nr:recombination protein RecR [Planctomycetota bacterium]NOG55290.1 recombination protein RecR [Planctomycetota bacterium]
MANQQDSSSRHTGPYPESVSRLMEQLGRLPGIGPRSAERLAFHILKSDRPEAEALAGAIQDVKRSVRYCSICYTITDHDPCPICADDRRDHGIILVVEQPKDLISLEQTGMHRGGYHVLLGRLSPLDGIEPADLTVQALMARIGDETKNACSTKVREVVFGLSPNLEGDGTVLYLTERLREADITLSRLARGLPSGSQIEYANKAVLADAIVGRQSIEPS